MEMVEYGIRLPTCQQAKPMLNYYNPSKASYTLRLLPRMNNCALQHTSHGSCWLKRALCSINIKSYAFCPLSQVSVPLLMSTECGPRSIYPWCQGRMASHPEDCLAWHAPHTGI